MNLIGVLDYLNKVKSGFLLSVILSLFVLLPKAYAAPADDGLGDWKLVKNRKGTKVYMRHTSETRLKTFRGIMEMSPQEPFSCITTYLDFENNHRIFHFVSKTEVLEKISDTEMVVRVHTLLPWPLKNREAVARVVVEQDPETLDVVARIKYEDTDRPVLDGYVRVPEFQGLLGVDLIGDKKILTTYEIVLDPGGNVPLWLVDVVLKDTPYFTLQKLQSYTNKPEYQNVKHDFIRYPTSW